MSVQLQQSPHLSLIPGRAPVSDSEGHASHHKASSLKEKMLRAANLVAADATRQSSPKAMAKACGLTNSLDSGSSSAPYDDEGETYLLIRQAFCASFDELIKQTHGSRQSIVEELWAALADYLDRMHARQDVAFNDAAVQFAITAELERQLRLANARYKELQHEVNSMRVQMAEPAQQSISEETNEHPEPANSDGAVAPKECPEECPVPVPQPAEDRSVLGLVQHQAPLAPGGGQATSPVTPADARRSQRSAALMRLANEGILVDTSLPQTLVLALAGPSLGAQGAAEEPQMTAEQENALEEARAEAVQQGILRAERERSMARQRGIQHQLQEQLDSMHRRTACIDSPVQLSAATSAAADSAESAGLHLSARSHGSVQGTPPQSAFQMRNTPAQPVTEAEHGLRAHGTRNAGEQIVAPAGYRPRSIAQKAGMNVWSRHGSRYGHGAQQAQRECSIPGPEDVPILDAAPGPLAQGLAAAAKERQSPVDMRKPRHMLLSTSVDTVLGDVFAETTSASETIAAEPHQGFMTFMRGHRGGHSASRSQAEAATASALAQSAAARSGLLATWHAQVARDACLLVTLKVALALAEQPFAQALVSEDILSPLASPAGAQAPGMRSAADVSRPPGASQRSAADARIATGHALRSPPAAASPMQLARASIQQWGKPRGSVSPAAESMVICGPTWSFPVEAACASPSSAGEPQAALQPAHLRGTGFSTVPQGSFRSAVDQHSTEADNGKARMPDMGMRPEEHSISFRCRQVTASLPDMAALQAAIRGQPRPGQSDAERAASRLLPDVAVAERALTLQTVQAAAEQVSASCAPDLQTPDQQAPWPLKKGAWDRIQQGARSVKPDSWQVNETALTGDAVDLQAALTVQAKPTAFENAADAALAAFADATSEGASTADVTSKAMSTAAAVTSRIIKQEALSSSASTSEQRKQPPFVGESTPAKGIPADSPRAASKQRDLGASKPAEAQRVQAALPAARDAAAASKVATRPHGVAQRLLARANCFAGLAQSPAKQGTSIEALPAAGKSAAAAATAPAGVEHPQDTVKAEAANTGSSSAQRSTGAPALAPSGPELEHEHAAANSSAQAARAAKSPVQEAAEKESALAASRSAEPSSVRSSFSAVTQRRRATLFGDSAGRSSPQSAVTETSQPAMPKGAEVTPRSVHDSPSPEEKSSGPGMLSCAPSMPPRSPHSTGKQSAAKREAVSVMATAQELLLPLARTSIPAASQVSPNPKGGDATDSSKGLPAYTEGKSPPAKSLGRGQQQPPSFAINASCQAISVTVASAVIDSGAAAQQPLQRASPSKASPTAMPPMLWPGQQVCQTPPGRSADAEKGALAVKGSAGHDGSPERDTSRDPLQVYSASVDSAQKAAKAAADRLTCLPASPQVEAAAGDVAAGEESCSVSDIQFSSDSDTDGDQSSYAVRRGHTEDSEWGASSLMTTGEQAAQADAAEAESPGTTRPSSAEDMYTAHSEAFQIAASETGLAALQEASLAARVEESISESTEVLMQTCSDPEMMHAELEVTSAQVITSTAAGRSEVDSTTEDQELDAMLASVLGTGSGQHSAQAAQEAPPAASAAEAQQEQLHLLSKPAEESAVGGRADMDAFHLPDNLFGSPLAGAAQGSPAFATKEADSGSDDDDGFVKKPMKKTARKGRRAGRK